MKEINLNNETVFKIVGSAIELFNLNGYSGTSISDIAKKAQLSKGILYHYFKNKDELYLYCARLCIDEYMKYLSEKLTNPTSITNAITENVKARIQFFNENPQYRTFFNYIVSRKPAHLAEELIKIRLPLTISNTKRIKEITGDIELGNGVFDDDIIAFTSILQNSFSFLLQDGYDENIKQKQIEKTVRLTKIFINGLKEDII